MTLSLDTTTAVDLLRRNRPEVRRRFEQARAEGRGVMLSTVALFELSYGAARSSRPGARMADVTDLLTQLELAEFDGADAHRAGGLRATLERGPGAIGTPDLFIAAQALERNWAVVTSNIRHFGRIEGLTLIDWRVSDAPLTAAEIAARMTQGEEPHHER